MSIVSQATALVREMEQILSDQVGSECPACGGARRYDPASPQIYPPPIAHGVDCVLVRARAWLGIERSGS